MGNQQSQATAKNYGLWRSLQNTNLANNLAETVLESEQKPTLVIQCFEMRKNRSLRFGQSVECSVDALLEIPQNSSGFELYALRCNSF
jgi:hypothetical protein